MGQWNKNWHSIPFTSHFPKTLVPVVNNLIRSKTTWPNMVNFTVTSTGDWQTGCVCWEVAQSRFHVDITSNFALKNNSMEFWPGPITRQIDVMFEWLTKWTWHHSKLAVEEVSFFSRLRVVLLQLLIYTWWRSRRYGLGCHAPMNPALVLIMAWCRIGNKPLSEPMLTRFADIYMRHYGEMSWFTDFWDVL